MDRPEVDSEGPACEEIAVGDTSNTVPIDTRATSNVFAVDRSCIPTVAEDEQDHCLQDLGIQVYNLDVLEEGILHQVDKAYEDQVQNQPKSILYRALEQKQQIRKEKEDAPASEPAVNVIIPPAESEMAKKIRLGEMTPFGTSLTFKQTEQHHMDNVEEYLKNQMKLGQAMVAKKKLSTAVSAELESKPSTSPHKSPLKKKVFTPKKKRRKMPLGTFTSEDCQTDPGKLLSERTAMEGSSGSEYLPSEKDEEDKGGISIEPKKRSRRVRERKVAGGSGSSEEWHTDDSDWEYSGDEKKRPRSKKGGKEQDDGNVDDYLKRLSTWEKTCDRQTVEDETKSLGQGFVVPLVIWNKLYNYQKVGVQWLWELHSQRCGGILGDEMGLGKTVQVIAFMSGLSVSKLVSRHGGFRGLGPVLIVCPTTLMHQWVKEMHTWWPQFRVALLHESGCYSGRRAALVSEIVRSCGVLVTSYVGCVKQCSDLLRYRWHYVVLDEGHKIRNPEAQVAGVVKQLATPHRLILSGSPMQNNLRELWSLFDFIFPGKLGTLPVFMAEFAVPITQGGYTNATQVQVATAFKCATVLKDTITPYLLRRMKADVKTHINLPPKNEQVLFCRLTEEQRQLYLEYLDSGEVDRILSGMYRVFVGLINLRKICNHPHLYSGGPKLFKWDDPASRPEEDRFGYWKKAGKMVVVQTLLRLWKKQGHRVLLFSQSKQMLHILEAFLQSQGYTYLKLDGQTGIASRQPLINKFNTEPEYFVFLSTTQVGGFGVNLTGADRVVIYDPDWNPATDTQARERAWRIGQTSQVTIYRLVTAGTIEEKIYHRQIFKQFLTNKVLSDPRQRRFFKSNDLFELFTLKDTDSRVTETSALFAGTGSEVDLRELERRQRVKRLREKMSIEVKSVKQEAETHNLLTQEKIEKMKKLAQELSRRIVQESAMQKPNDVDQVKKEEEVAVEQKDWGRRTKKKKKRRRERDAVFEGEVIPHLVKHRRMKQRDEAQQDHAQQDDYILQKLLSKSSVQTALRHDRIMEGGPSDYALVEGEAELVAREAVKALKESRRHCRRPFDNQPSVAQTTKPRFGVKKKPVAVPGEAPEEKIAMSSAELLSRIKERNLLLNAAHSVQQEQAAASPVSDHAELLTDIRNFISFGAVDDNRATTQEIINRDRLPAGKSPLFKALLHEICDFHRTSSGEGVWMLRQEFRW